MLLPLIALATLMQGKHIGDADAQADVKTVAVLPWSFRGGTDTAVQTAKDTISLFFEKTKYEAVPTVRVNSAWEDKLGNPPVKQIIKDDDPLPDLPSPKQLLALGQKLNVDLVCAGRAKWHTKSVWISLGPKTKADCTVDMLLIDVKKQEVLLDQKDINADDTRKESGLETAGALFVSMGITAFSGGPKTPHQQRAAQLALGLAFEPWLKTVSPQQRKIG